MNSTMVLAEQQEATAVVTLPAVRGEMGTSEYFLTSVPFGVAAKLFSYNTDEADAPSTERHQRKISTRRVPEIAAYITQHADYIFSSVVVSVEGVSYNEMTGELSLPLDAVYRVNDGQHRIAGIAEAIKDDLDLRHDMLPVMILPDEELQRSQQVFSDLNRTVQKTSKTLDILYDRRTPLNRITAAVAEEVSLFGGRVDTEHASVSPSSAYFTTMATLQAANTDLLGNLPGDVDPELEAQARDLAVWFWNFITPYVKPWEVIASGEMEARAARDEYLSSYAMALRAIAQVGRQFVGDNQSALHALQAIDWRKTNPDWKKIGVVVEGSVVSRGPTRKALVDYLSQKLLFAPAPQRNRRRAAAA